MFREYSADYRTDVIDIPLEPLGELEYKLGLNEGDSIVYQWDAVDLKDVEMLYAEFHGHTEPVGNVGDLMYYRKASGGTERGTLVAPFTGIHGWYLRNDGEQPIVVRLKVAGFYELLAAVAAAVSPAILAQKKGRAQPRSAFVVLGFERC